MAKTQSHAPARALMTREEIREAVKSSPAGVLPAEVKRDIEERKALNIAVAHIAATNWGSALSFPMQQAVANYCRSNGLDVGEIDVLGGRIYRNAHYYLRRLTELTEAGKVEYARHDMIHVDPRLATMEQAGGGNGAWAIEEQARRARERIVWACPENAAAACVYRVKLVGMGEEFAAAKWIVKGRTKKAKRSGGGEYEYLADPVGDEFPELTVITRAARRCLRYIALNIPGLGFPEADIDDAGVALSEAIRAGAHVARAREAAEDDGALKAGERVAIQPGVSVRITDANKAVATPEDPYATAEVAEVAVPPIDAELQAALDEEVSADDEPQYTGSAAVPLRIPGPHKDVPLGAIATEALVGYVERCQRTIAMRTKKGQDPSGVEAQRDAIMAELSARNEREKGGVA